MQRRSGLASRHAAALALVCGWGVCVSADLLDTGGAPYFRDTIELFIPVRAFLHESIKSGRLPQWYPYELSGAPFIGQIITATFHPQTLLFLPFSPTVAVKLNILFAFLFGAMGAYRLARALPASRPAALISAAALAFGGYAVGVHHNLPYLMGQVTLPWVAWAALLVVRRGRRRDVAALAICWALIFLGGDAQGFGMGAILIIAAVAVEGVALDRIRRVALSVVLTCGLIAAEMLPALAIYGESFRMGGDLGTQPGRSWALHPWRLAELFVPGFVPERQMGEVATWLLDTFQGTLWSSTIFAGGIVLGLAAMALARPSRQTTGFGVVAVSGLWMALGERGGLWQVAARALPMLGHFLYAEKYLALFFTGLAPLAAMGFDVARERPRRAAQVLLTGAACLAVIAAVLLTSDVVGALFASKGHVLDRGTRDGVEHAWLLGAITTGLFLSMAGAVVWAAQARPVLWNAVAALAFLELWHGNVGHLPQASRELLEKPSPLATALLAGHKQDQPPVRVLSAGGVPGWGYGMLHDPDVFAGGITGVLRQLSEAPFGIGTVGQYSFPAVGMRALPLTYADPRMNIGLWGGMMNVCARIGAPDKLGEGEKVIAVDDALHVAAISRHCGAYARLSGATSVADATEATGRISPVGSIVWEGGGDLPAVTGRTSVRDYQPGRIAVDTDATAPAALTVAETFASGWSATVDGQPADVYPANYIALGVLVPAGHHTVELRYRTPSLWLGISVSLLTLAVTMLLVFAGPRRRVEPIS